MDPDASNRRGPSGKSGLGRRQSPLGSTKMADNAKLEDKLDKLDKLEAKLDNLEANLEAKLDNLEAMLKAMASKLSPEQPIQVLFEDLERKLGHSLRG